MEWDLTGIESWPWSKHPPGLLCLEGGNAEQVNTGGWRSRRPVVDLEKCSHCLICFIYCPDSSIKVEAEKMVGIDYYYCKGCGICATECPREAIKLVEEAEALEAERRGG